MHVKPNIDGSELCLATVTTDSFVPGTLVMLYSFLKYNNWFQGEIVIIHDELSSENREFFLNLNSRTKFLKVSRELQERVDQIVVSFPEFASKRARFYSIEAFRLRGYDRLLFCDGDLLFRSSISDLFEMPESLIVSGDGHHYLGQPREWRAHPDQILAGANKTAKYRKTFNSGVILLDREFLTDNHYAGLLDLIVSEMYCPNTAKLADQLILNVHFSGQQHLVSAEYNYVMQFHQAIYEYENLKPHEAKVLHFNGNVKPWLADRVLWASQLDPAFIKPFGFWYDNYVECLQSLYVNRQFDPTTE